MVSLPRHYRLRTYCRHHRQHHHLFSHFHCRQTQQCYPQVFSFFSSARFPIPFQAANHFYNPLCRVRIYSCPQNHKSQFLCSPYKYPAEKWEILQVIVLFKLSWLTYFALNVCNRNKREAYFLWLDEPDNQILK